MASYHEQIQKWILNSVTIVLSASIAIVSQNQFLVSALSTKRESINEVSLSNPATVKTVVKNQSIYRNHQFGFNFYYSQKEFVIKVNPKNFNSILATIDIWTKEHAQKIRDGVYEEGTEYPANVQITIYKNPQRLPLLKWIQQSQNFAVSGKFKNIKVAGQNAVQFQSLGLYDDKQTAFVNPKDGNMIVITLSQSVDKNNGVRYQKVYSQVISSFSFKQGTR